VDKKCCDKFRLRIRLPHNSRDLLDAANLRHGAGGFTSPPKEGVLRIFFVLKNPKASTGFEPANLGTKGQHATSRPPKPISMIYSLRNETRSKACLLLESECSSVTLLNDYRVLGPTMYHEA
jgi:hypothetical protein